MVLVVIIIMSFIPFVWFKINEKKLTSLINNNRIEWVHII